MSSFIHLCISRHMAGTQNMLTEWVSVWMMDEKNLFQSLLPPSIPPFRSIDWVMSLPQAPPLWFKFCFSLWVNRFLEHPDILCVIELYIVFTWILLAHSWKTGLLHLFWQRCQHLSQEIISKLMNGLTGWKIDPPMTKIKPMEKVKLNSEDRIILRKMTGNHRQLKFMIYNLYTKLWTMQLKSSTQQIFIMWFLCAVIMLGTGIMPSFNLWRRQKSHP